MIVAAQARNGGQVHGQPILFTGVTVTAAMFDPTAATLGICQSSLAGPSASYFGRATRLRGRITDEVRRIYNLKDQMLPKDQRITLNQPIETVLTWKTAQMKIWTETIRPTINRCIHENTIDDEQDDDRTADLSISSTDLSTSTAPRV